MANRGAASASADLKLLRGQRVEGRGPVRLLRWLWAKRSYWILASLFGAGALFFATASKTFLGPLVLAVGAILGRMVGTGWLRRATERHFERTRTGDLAIAPIWIAVIASLFGSMVLPIVLDPLLEPLGRQGQALLLAFLTSVATVALLSLAFIKELDKYDDQWE